MILLTHVIFPSYLGMHAVNHLLHHYAYWTTSNYHIPYTPRALGSRQGRLLVRVPADPSGRWSEQAPAPAYYALALVVALSRIHVRIHHASDVDVAAGIGTGAVRGAVARRPWR